MDQKRKNGADNCAGAKKEVSIMMVKVTREFRDRENNLKLRKVGEKFEATESRAKRLEAFGFVSRVRGPIKIEPPEA